MRLLPGRRFVVAAAVITLVVLFGTISSAAGDGPGRTVFVSHSAVAGASDKSCSSAAYSSVQEAINAAPAGGFVYLCGTTPFSESVAIQSRIELGGDPGAALQAPTSDATPATTFFSSQGLQTPNSVVTVLGNANVQIEGLTIEGPFQNAGCGGDDFGVLQVGGRLQMNGDRVLNVGAADQTDLGGCQYGVGIQVGREYWPNLGGTYNVVDFVGNAEIQDTTVAGYQKNGITADGPGSKVDLRTNTIDGGGPTATIARNGIQISRGATGHVQNDTIDNNEYTGPGSSASATGVLVYGGCGDPLSTNVHIQNNTVVNNDAGIDLSNSNSACTASATSPTDVQVSNNLVMKTNGETNASPFQDQNGNSYTGYQVGIADAGDSDQVHDNQVIGTIAGSGNDTAFGPQTAPGGVFLAPIDIQTYPPVNSQIHNNTFDNAATYPPY